MSCHQLLPELVPEEYESLKDSIAERGVDVPIIVDEDGNTIDGFHRLRACHELGIKDYPTEVRKFASDAEKYELVLRLHCRRRQLTRKQRRRLIAAYLVVDPHIADNYLAKLIGGVSKNTVASVRRELVAKDRIPKLDRLRGEDGKTRPTKYDSIIANSRRERDVALKIIRDLPERKKGSVLDVTTAKRRAAQAKYGKEHDQLRLPQEPSPNDAIRLYHCPFQELESVAGIEPESVHLVCTDIPYEKAFLPQIEALGQFAERVLVQGGMFVTYSGKIWLPDVIDSLRRSLTYAWTNASVWTGKSEPVRVGRIRVLSSWKPILVFSKGPPRKRQWIDVSQRKAKEKQWHPWQQPLEEVEQLVGSFSKVGELVVDPCGGGFTTAVACRRLGRRCIACDVDEGCVVRGQVRLASDESSQQRAS